MSIKRHVAQSRRLLGAGFTKCLVGKMCLQTKNKVAREPFGNSPGKQFWGRPSLGWSAPGAQRKQR